MNQVMMVLIVLAAIFVLCQWYVFISVRRYLFQRYEPVKRTVAFAVLLAFCLVNILAVKVAMRGELFPPDTHGHKIAGVFIFSYLGYMLVLSLVFVLFGFMVRILRFKDWLLRVDGSGNRCLNSEQGCVYPPGSKLPLDTSARTGDSVPETEMPAIKEKIQEKPVSDMDTVMETPLPAPPMGRRTFLKWSTAAAVVTVGGSMGNGIAEAYEPPVIEEFHLFHSSLKGINRPVTIMQLTDFHFGMFMGSKELNRLVEMLNALEGDAVIITGDLYHSPMSPIEAATPTLQKLKPRRWGNFAVLGNHDFYAGVERSVRNMKAGGLTLLRDQWLTFTSGSARIHLGGIDDPMDNWMWGARFPKFPSFMDAAPRDPGFRILLSHRPNVLPIAAQTNIDLVLAGHIHGGQIIFPVPGSDRGVSVAAVASKFTHGWYSENKVSMYLNRGAGLTFLPWRVNCPPEIAVFHLYPSDDATLRVSRKKEHLIII